MSPEPKQCEKHTDVCERLARIEAKIDVSLGALSRQTLVLILIIIVATQGGNVVNLFKAEQAAAHSITAPARDTDASVSRR